VRPDSIEATARAAAQDDDEAAPRPDGEGAGSDSSDVTGAGPRRLRLPVPWPMPRQPCGVSYTDPLVDSANRRAGVTQVPIATHRYADTLVAMPAGRIDHANASQFENELLPLLEQARDGNGALVLDFSGVEYISSGGLRVLMIAATRMRSQQGRLLVSDLRSVVAEIFAISRFDRVLTVAPTLETALGSCSAAALAAYRRSTATP